MFLACCKAHVISFGEALNLMLDSFGDNRIRYARLLGFEFR